VSALRVYNRGETRAVQSREPPVTSEALDRLVVRLLAVHDEDAHRASLQPRLWTAGFAVQTVSLGVSALKAVHEWNPEAILLDVTQPRDSFTWIPMLRRLTQAPIIMLSAKETVSEKVAALVRGADDYVTRPFDMDELIARVHSALRRPHLAVTETLRYADLMADAARRIVVRSNRDIELSKREFALLLMLIRNPKRILTRTELLDGVWGGDAHVTSAMVDTYISYLRAKIDAGCDRKLIHTVRGVGYTLRDTGE
jgi:DNA-binding response OmpR family regulator